MLTKAATTASLFGLLVSSEAQAANPLGLYVGAGAGQAHLRVADTPFLDGTHFDETDAGWTAFAGVQPLPFLGAELQYLDFGHTSREKGDFQTFTVSSRARAISLFGTGTVSLPFVDLYMKAGIGRLQTKRSTDYYPGPMYCSAPFIVGDCHFRSRVDSSSGRFGGGVGVQFKLSSLAIRGEYVRFSGSDGDPDLLSVALLWKF